MYLHPLSTVIYSVQINAWRCDGPAHKVASAEQHGLRWVVAMVVRLPLESEA